MKLMHTLEVPKEFKIVVISNKKYLVSDVTGNFIQIPWYVKVVSETNKMSLFSLNGLGSLIQIIDIFLAKTKFPYARKLIFRGLGLKFSFIQESKILELKLGYSHTIRIVVPSRFQIKVFKSSLVIMCNDLSALKNFIYKIKRMRIPNAYKGKGIWLKNEKKKLKTIKKN